MYFAQTNSGFLYYYEPNNTYYRNQEDFPRFDYNVILYKKLFELTPLFISNIRNQPHFVVTNVGFGVANIINGRYDYFFNNIEEMSRATQVYADVRLFIPIYSNGSIERMNLIDTHTNIVTDWEPQNVDIVKSGTDYFYRSFGYFYNPLTMEKVRSPNVDNIFTDLLTLNSNFFKFSTLNGPMLINILDNNFSFNLIDLPNNYVDAFLLNWDVFLIPDIHFIIPTLEYDVLPFLNTNDRIIEMVRDAVFDNAQIPIILSRIIPELARIRRRHDNTPDWDLSPRQMSPPSPIRVPFRMSSPSPERVPIQEDVLLNDYRLDAIGVYFSMIYNIPFKVPEFVIINGLRINFIPFSQVSTIQIVKYELDPYLQMYAGLPSFCNPLANGLQNRIITLFGNDGMTYLVKAKYNPITQEIFSPV
jgi:hypothetical protein